MSSDPPSSDSETRPPEAVPPPVTPPVILVGLPRSGSTLLTRVLNDSPDLLMVNDLYYVQEVDAVGAFEHTASLQAGHLAQFLMSKLRDRSRAPEDRTLVRCLELAEEQLDEVEARVGEAVASDCDWAELLRAGLSAAASVCGKRVWAYNTPQDFLHLDRLRQAFPGARFIFLLRNPYDTLRSYKNVRHEGNDPRRYHPVVQGALWRSCVKTYLANRGAADVTLVRYEDLVASPEATLHRLERFLNVTIPIPSIAALGSNSSFANGDGKQLSTTEQWLCDIVIGRLRETLGYERATRGPRLRDLPEVLAITLRNVSFYTSRALASRDVRARLKSGVKSLLGMH